VRYHLKCIKWIAPVLMLMVLISGCSTVTPTTPTNQQPAWSLRQTALNNMRTFHIKGKIGIQTPDDSGSATVNWQQNQDQFMLSLSGAIGGDQLIIRGTPGHVTLQTPEGKIFTATSAEALLKQQWHWDLPISNLKYWIRGIPVPNHPYQSQFDTAHRLTSLQQDGSTVEYLAYQNSGALDLPTKITITSPPVKTKIIIYEWNTHLTH